MRGDDPGKSSLRADGPHRVLSQKEERGNYASGETPRKEEASATESVNGLELGPLWNPVRR